MAPATVYDKSDLRSTSVDGITEFVGVYDADASLVGEISYWIGARLGRRHCSLCDLTHGLFTRKPEWTQCTRQLSVPFVTYHRDDAADEVLRAADGNFPVVLARRGGVLGVAITPAELERFAGSTSAFAGHLARLLEDDTRI
jgi:hypothetical protein